MSRDGSFSDEAEFVFRYGHDPHHNGPTMDLGNIHPLFLRFDNSSRDQVSENGLNHRLKAIFAT